MLYRFESLRIFVCVGSMGYLQFAQMTTREILMYAVGVIYLIYTLSFALYFRQTAGRIFNSKQIRIHNFFIWLLPLVWIAILKSIMKPTSKRHSQRDKSNSIDLKSGNNFANSLIFFLHGQDN